MLVKTPTREEVLESLNRTVLESAAYFGSAHEALFDGHQSAHAVLAQLVFWHKQYVRTLRDLAQGDEPTLLVGTFAQINQRARREYASYGMVMLAHEFSCAHRDLVEALNQLPDWSIDFPIKRDGDHMSIDQRLLEIEGHIHRHVQRFQAAHA
ncbi:MAG: hypothetical protein IPK19_15490 [Chloroflexi bacterium]|nr:hypothetical protein [Chloroflexota bacterium]